MYLAYIDDSEFSAKKDQQKSVKPTQSEQFQVLCAVVVPDHLFAQLEVRFTMYALSGYSLPESFPPEFEFHAHELFHGTGFFEKWEQPKRFAMFERCTDAVSKLMLPVLYGAVDKGKLAKQIYKSANPLDMSFRLCIEQVQKWLTGGGPSELGLLIADNFDDGKKRNLKQVFRDTAVRLKVEENQLVGIFGGIGVLVEGLKGA